MESVVANSTPLISLAKTNELDILKDIYDQIVILKQFTKRLQSQAEEKKGALRLQVRNG